MEIKTYRAKSLQEALRWIRRDLGPEAAVLHTRELRTGLLGWLGGRQLEVTAGLGVRVPSRFGDDDAPPPEPADDAWDVQDSKVRPWDALDPHEGGREPPPDGEPGGTWDAGDAPRSASWPPDLSQPLWQLLSELLDSDMDEESARELVERVRCRSAREDLGDYLRLKARLARLLENDVVCAGPLTWLPGNQRVVAFVGPTGVGKTTTIAKLAASFHLREQKRVGLVTMDTYRVAAVDQLRTYADIIDLPMEVVANPRDVRTAIAKLSEVELILIDTAGHSPSDERKMQELRTLLQESQADEVQLVVSGVANRASVKQALARFAAVGATRLVLTKLDEAPGLGHLWPALRDGQLPLTYVTHGQNVPDDFAAADARLLVRRLLKMDGGR